MVAGAEQIIISHRWRLLIMGRTAAKSEGYRLETASAVACRGEGRPTNHVLQGWKRGEGPEKVGLAKQIGA
jgi:hypothetical protein